MTADRLPSYEDVQRLRGHWAVSAVPGDVLDKAHRMANDLIVRRQIADSFAEDNDESQAEETIIRHVSTAYEIAAAENVSHFIGAGDDDARLMARIAASQAYDLLRSLTRPKGGDDALLHMLTLAALAYAGDRAIDLGARLPVASSEEVPSGPWDRRLLLTLHDCWIRLFRKSGWDDLAAVGLLIKDLRDRQSEFEPAYLDRPEAYENRLHALRLIALYNWARATELLAQYMLQGDIPSINTAIDQFFEHAELSALQAGDAALHSLLRWLLIAAKRMISLSLWGAANQGPRIREFIETLTSARQMFEFLPPQRAALHEAGILDPTKRAVVVDMPTSSGKTLLAEFRILQALNQFQHTNGWVAYVAPTKALVSQLTRRLRRDLGLVNVRVEELSGAVDVDVLESELLSSDAAFQVLVCTPEKLGTIIRRDAIKRPLALALIDEAHNLDDESRGLRLELLLATIKRERPDAAFMLMMPYVPNAADLATWLADDESRTAVASFGAAPWRPNDVLIGKFSVDKGKTPRDWTLRFDTLLAPRKSLDIRRSFTLTSTAPLKKSWSGVAGNNSLSAASMSIAMSKFGERTSVCVLQRPDYCWSTAREIRDSLESVGSDADIALVQRYLSTEISPSFELIGMLDKGVAVHHSGLSDETRALVEWLVERQKVRILCATSTIAQGINFPVSSVFLASVSVAGKKPRVLSYREFWNLAGRTGRVGQSPVGVVGLTGDDAKIDTYFKDAADDLISRLEALAATLQADSDENLRLVTHSPDWEDFRSYIAHLYAEREKIEITGPEQLLRNTFGYTQLSRSAHLLQRTQAKRLLDLTRRYAEVIARDAGVARMADATGFSPEGVRRALIELSKSKRLSPHDWEPRSLFSDGGDSALPRLIGVMLQLPQLRSSLEAISSHGSGSDQIARVATAWVNGSSIESIAKEYFAGVQEDPKKFTTAVTAATRAIYRALSYAATWGISALSHLPESVSGINPEHLSSGERRLINLLPAMLHHGVATEDAVAMRISSVPRTAAEALGKRFRTMRGESDVPTIEAARSFVSSLGVGDWDRARPERAAMSGSDYLSVWRVLTGA